jgi:hypothetical protein
MIADRPAEAAEICRAVESLVAGLRDGRVPVRRSPTYEAARPLIEGDPRL